VRLQFHPHGRAVIARRKEKIVKGKSMKTMEDVNENVMREVVGGDYASWWAENVVPYSTLVEEECGFTLHYTRSPGGFIIGSYTADYCN
jgi:hypothetical protein